MYKYVFDYQRQMIMSVITASLSVWQKINISDVQVF